MASQAQINEKKWKDYCAELNKAGMVPTPQMEKGYLQTRGYWNTVDTDATDLFNQLLNRS